ncbi:hypothetical protein B0H10DRAFT_2234241 [Mycena sp. CBHHK59/15]|nr:hypothetical protein B0H10DRAFT_2234241 [Mycena sp. CBHHK59/15]
MFEVDITDCYSIRDFAGHIEGGARILTAEDAALYDRLILASASRSLLHEERVAKKEVQKRGREVEPGEVEDTETVIKKMRFSKVKAEPVTHSVPKGAGKSEVKPLTEEELAARKERKAKKAAARKAKKEKAAAMDVDWFSCDTSRWSQHAGTLAV